MFHGGGAVRDETGIREEVEEAVAAEREARAEAAAAKPAPEVDGVSFSEKEVVDALYDNQVGDARLLTKLAYGRFCYDNGAKEWNEFANHHWSHDGSRNMEILVDRVADRYKIEADRKEIEAAKMTEDQAAERKRTKALADALRKRAFAMRSGNRISAVMERATAGVGSLGISGEEWDSNPTILPVANGVVDLETGKLYPGRPEQYMRKSSPIEYHGLNAEAPTWDEVTEKSLRKSDPLLDYFGRVVGYSTTGLAAFKDFYCAYGPGGDNGKSVIFETLQHVLGSFAGTIGVATLLDEGFVRSAAGPSPDILKLRGLRMAVTSEAEQQHKFSMAKIKAIVSGGDRIQAREPYAKRDVEFTPTHSLILHTNFLPKAKGNDRPFFKRLRVIPFRALFVQPGEAVNEAEHIYAAMPRAKLDRALADEGPGILAYMVRNAMRLLRDMDMSAPPEVLAETKDYQEDQDLVGRFLSECCEIDGERGTQMGVIHAAFARWCIDREGYEENGRKKPPSLIWLSREFKNRVEIKKLQEKPVAIYGLHVNREWLGEQQGEVPF